MFPTQNLYQAAARRDPARRSLLNNKNSRRLPREQTIPRRFRLERECVFTASLTGSDAASTLAPTRHCEWPRVIAEPTAEVLEGGL